MVMVQEKEEKHPRNKKEGFLEQQGYRPDSLHDPSTEKEYVKSDKQSDDQITDYSHKKIPRPDPLGKQKMGKRDIDKKREKIESLKRNKEIDESKNVYRISIVVLVIGIIILLIGFLISYQNYIEFQTQSKSVEERGYFLLLDLQNYPGLTHESDNTGKIWDYNKFLNLDSEEIEYELDPDINFLVEVQDLSQYQIKYNRTVENGLAWSNLDIEKLNPDQITDKFKITSYANIYVSSYEIHLVKIIVYIWE